MRTSDCIAATPKDVGKVLMRAAHIAMGRPGLRGRRLRAGDEFDQVDRDILPSLQTFRQLSAARSVARSGRTASTSTSCGQGDSWQSIATRAGQGLRQRRDAGDHERPRGQRAAAGRRARQDRRRRLASELGRPIPMGAQRIEWHAETVGVVRCDRSRSSRSPTSATST